MTAILAVSATLILLGGALVTQAGATGSDAPNSLVRPDDFTGQRVPLGIFVTNWDCGPCAPANQYLDAYIPTQDNDVALIRVHCWWPGPYDPLYLANSEQATFLVENTPTGSDYAPHLWLDNYVDAGSNGAGYENYFENQKLVPAPLEISVNFDADNERTLVHLEILDEMPAGDYRLYVAITEDNVFAPGTNGEDWHNQVFRRLYPDVEGLAISTEIGVQEHWIDTEIYFRWVFEECRATAYVQEYDSAVVQNSGTIFLSEGGLTASPEAPPELVTRLDGAHPNPFNPLTQVSFSLGREQQVTLVVYDLSGHRVAELARGTYAAGSHSVQWNGKNAAGRDVPSGTYMIYMRSEDGNATSKAVLVR